MKKSLMALVLFIVFATIVFAYPTMPTTVPENGMYAFTGYCIVNDEELEIDMTILIVKTDNTIEFFGDDNMNGSVDINETESIIIFTVSSGQITASTGTAPSGPSILFMEDSDGLYWFYALSTIGEEVYSLMYKVEI